MLVSLCLGVCICMNNCIVCVCVRIAYAQFLGMGLVPSGSVGAWWVWACTSMDLRSGSVPRTLSCHVPLLTTSIPLKSEIWDSRPISNDFFWGGVFLGLHPQHMELPRLGVKLELQLLGLCHRHSHNHTRSKPCQ